MTTPQAGIFAQGTRHHLHLELDVHPSVDRVRLGRALAGLREPAVTSGGANVVVGFGAGLWVQVAPEGSVPDGLRPFAGVAGIDGHGVPAAQHDVWVWIHGAGPDVVFDVGRAVVACFGGLADVAYEQACFVYKDSRDLTGFIDGTANPQTDEAAAVALIPPGEPGELGSFAFTSRWVHDLGAFHSLSVPDQEDVFGRSKADSVEMDDDTKPADAHIARVEVDGPDGEELELYRRSTPFGTLEEHGLQFVAFSASLDRYDVMLARMFGLADDGVRDHLTDFTTAVGAAFWFVPGTATLDALIQG